MSSSIKKPGYMFRACIAWAIFNTILLFTLAALIYILKGHLQAWYVMIPIIVAVVVSEWVIMAETIAPIVKEWITQEEYVKEGESPSWKKN